MNLSFTAIITSWTMGRVRLDYDYPSPDVVVDNSVGRNSFVCALFMDVAATRQLPLLKLHATWQLMDMSFGKMC